MPIHWIDFRDIPLTTGGLSNLYLDYLDRYENVAKYYNGDFRNVEHLKTVIGLVGKKTRDRSTLVRVLTEQNKDFHCSIKTLANIDLLYEDNTFTIVTGQQVGLLSGPLYTLYKTITALKLTEELNSKFPDFHFVPIFWLEGEDHDFDEINHINVIGQQNKPMKIEYLFNGKPLEKNVGAVGEVQLDGYIENFFQQVDETLINTEFKPHLLSVIKNFYRQGTTFSKAFVGLMNSFIEDSGLIFINSNHRELKKLVSPIFQREVNEHPKVCELVIDRSAELEEKYHAQIKPKAVNLFLFYKGGRYLIEPRDTTTAPKHSQEQAENEYSLKGIRHYLSGDELRQIAGETPELLSPNVVLRPICQDSFLPTVIYVAGPSEIAYFAQLKPVYEFFDATMPILYPRASVTILEEKLEKILEKYGLQLTELFGNVESIYRKVSERISEVKIEDLFGRAAPRLTDTLSELKSGITQIDPTLSGLLDHTKSKMEFQLNVLKEKTVAAQKKKNEIALQQIEKVANNICPYEELQEREINVIYFMNKYGMEFVKWLSGEVIIDKFKHQVIHL